jgi:antitoxin ParD1/3/4
MSKIEKISIAITRAQHAKIKAAVGRGDYASTSEVIRTALRAWELKEELRRIEGERIGRLWDEGIASGPAVDGPPVMERLRAKYAALEKSKTGKKRSSKVA